MTFSLRIQNYQSIVDTEVIFEGFTCITGRSNLGKSALIRAFNSWAYNVIPAPSPVRLGTDFFILTGSFSDPGETVAGIKSIVFTKGKSVNKYTINYHNGTSKDYPKVGIGTPQELKDLGFSILETEREEEFCLQIQEQMDPLFLVKASETTLTGVLNKLFGIAPYERALRSINSDIIATNRQFDNIGRDIQSRECDLIQAQAVAEQAFANFYFLETAQGQADDLHGEVSRIDDGIHDFVALQALCHEIGHNLEIRQGISRDKAKAISLNFVVQRLVSVLRGVTNLQSVQEGYDSSVKDLSHVRRGIAVIQVPLLILRFLSTLSEGAEKLERCQIGVTQALAEIERLRDGPGKVNNLNLELMRLYHISEEAGKLAVLEGRIYDFDSPIWVTQEDQKLIADYKAQLIDSIPRCPTCHQPLIENHGHDGN